MQITEIAIDLIDEDAGQPRYQFDDEALEELKNSIAELGLLSPIKVRPERGRYRIVFGNRRYKACQMLGLPSIPCIISTALSELDIYLEQVAENLTREGFSPIEEAEAFDRLLNDPKFHSSVKFLSSKLGKPESYIKGKCDLLNFGPEVRKLIVSGTAIRKGRLTEDQLKPLKDLPAEYRDSLAMIAAQDEMPASDMKKIARMFKDSSISDSTKGKLLYKSGPGLLDTWSAMEQSKAERAKTDDAPAAKAATRKAKTLPAEASTDSSVDSSMDSSANSPADSSVDSSTDSSAAPPDISATPSPAALLDQLLAATSAHLALSAAQRDSFIQFAAEHPSFASDADTLIAKLETLLADWREIRKLAEAAATLRHNLESSTR